MLEVNTTLIDFEFGFNTFRLQETRKIQELLRNNKALYDAERLKEWRERKLMRDEDQQLQAKYLKEHSKQEQVRIEEETKELRESQIEERWKKYILESEIEKQMQI